MNCAYHEKEQEKQIDKIRQFGTDKEVKIINKCWDLRNKKGNQLLTDFGDYLGKL